MRLHEAFQKKCESCIENGIEIYLRHVENDENVIERETSRVHEHGVDEPGQNQDQRQDHRRQAVSVR